MKNNILLLITIGLIFLPITAKAQTMAEFTCNPVFTTQSVDPNILIILDNSRSMNMPAYGYENSALGAYDYEPDNFDPNNSYYGYFDSTATYSYASNTFTRDAVYTNGNWDGNFLNWVSMRRVDVARKVLVGGLCTSRQGGGNRTVHGEDPNNGERALSRYIKFYEDVSAYTPLAHDGYFFVLDDDGTFKVFEFNDPAQFDYSSDFTLVCSTVWKGCSYSYCDYGYTWYFHDYLFNYNSGSYKIEKRNTANPGCNSGDYNEVTTASSSGSYALNIEKDLEAESELFVDGDIAGVLQRVGDKARFGLEYFNSDNEGGFIKHYIGGNTTNLVTALQNQSSDTGTPLAESVYGGVLYYRQDSPYYHNGDYTTNQQKDPFWYDDENQYVECGKNFILLITDGISSADQNIPANPPGEPTADLKDYDTDGVEPAGYDYSGSDYLDDVALWAHTNDMRPDADFPDLPGDQVITLYSVFAFGTGAQLIKDACKNGAFIDKDGDKKPDTVGDARGGQWSDLGSNEEWDEDGDGEPDTYFESNSGYELEAKILAAINAILQRAASGTAVSILSTSAEGEGSLYQAFFKPTVFDNLREINWVGYLNSLWVDSYGNLREDTEHDDALVYSEDKIIQFTIDEASGDTAIKRFHDNDGDGNADIVAPATEPAPYETVLLSELDPQWEAGKKLAMRDAATRTIKTWVDIDGDGEVDENVDVTGDGIPEADGEYIDFHETNKSVLRPFLDVATDDEAATIINFIRGEASSTNYRDRNITIDGTEYVWKLGDIVYSTPTVVGKPMENYHQYYSDVSYAQFLTDATYPGQPWDVKLWKNRGVTVYVGANDGMLHAFKAGTFNEGDNPDTDDKEEHGWYSTVEYPPTTDEGLGDERWAYIPYNLLPHLKWLTRPDYTHVYYVDLKPKVTDARIFYDPATGDSDDYHPNGWGTILIGGMRLGGGEYTFTEDFDNDPGTPDEERTFRSAYFAMDITVPNNPELLAEVTDPNMGFTTSYPAIARVETNEGFQNPDDDKWYCIVGSGPTGCDGDSDQEGYIYAFEMSDGGMDHVFGPFDDFAFMANPITLDINLNYNVESVYIGETHDPSHDSDPANDQGKIYHISTRNNADPAVWAYQTDPANWVDSVLFNPATPITASPTASIDEDENIWIYFGTGRYYKSEDKTDVTQQYFYGIKDPCPYGVCPVGSDAVANGANIYDASNIVILTNGEVVGATATTWDAFVDEVQAKDGWKIELAAGGERVLNRPSILGGVVLFAPFTPESSICGYGGSGALYALYYETGTSYYEDILGTADYAGGKKESVKMISLDKGITSEIGLHVGQKAESTGFIQQGTGKVFQVEVDPALNIKSGIIGWMQY